MGYNSRYFVNKDERAKQAKEHTERMERLYKKEIKRSIVNSKIYDGYPAYEPLTISVVDEDSVSAILNHHYGKTAVLNFASFKNPGGMFLNGSKAQEECLCHESFLYNVLSELQDYYDKNKTMLNKSLYQDRLIYSPDVLFEKADEKVFCDVITCAAPNKTAAQKYCSVTDEQNYRALRERIEFVCAVLADQHVETAILGAFGCGVFGQDATEVAKLFQMSLENYPGNLKRVVFAIPGTMDKANLNAFKKVFAKGK